MLKKVSFLKDIKWSAFFANYGRIVFLFLSIPIILIYSILWIYNSTETKARLNADYDKILTETILKTEETFAELDSIYASIISERETTRFLSETNLASRSASVLTEQLHSLLSHYHSRNALIGSIYIYSTTNKYVLNSNTDIFSNSYIYNFADKACFDDYFENEHFVSVRTLSHSGIKRKFLTCYYPIYITNKMDGILCINLWYDDFKALFTASVPENSQFSLFYEDEAIVNQGELTAAISSVHKQLNGKRLSVKNGGKTVIGSRITPRNMAILIEYGFLLENSSFFNIRTIILSLFTVLVISLLLSLVITKNFYKMFAGVVIETTDIINIYGNDKDYSEKMDKFAGRILSTYKDNKILEEKIYDRMNNLRNIQFKALQAQITPHFLFNTLNIINLLELKIIGRNTEISKTVNALSEILRYSMDSNDYIISFDDELKYTQKYLDIQKLRYGDDLTINYDIAENTKNIPVIKFILQPLLENAIHYALAKNEHGIVTLKTKLFSEKLVIEISNNGISVSDKDVELLNKKLLTGTIEATHVSGLFNVNKRMQTIYGNEFKCTITNNTDATTVTLIIPQK